MANPCSTDRHERQPQRDRDDQIIPLLQALRRVTFFTLDVDFAKPQLCHPSYCLVYLAVPDDQAAAYVRRVLKHPALNTQAKRMGAVVRASDAGLHIWRRNLDEQQIPWPASEGSQRN